MVTNLYMKIHSSITVKQHQLRGIRGERGSEKGREREEGEREGGIRGERGRD